jgi:hypothetical protein
MFLPLVVVLLEAAADTAVYPVLVEGSIFMLVCSVARPKGCYYNYKKVKLQVLTPDNGKHCNYTVISLKFRTELQPEPRFGGLPLLKISR